MSSTVNQSSEKSRLIPNWAFSTLISFLILINLLFVSLKVNAEPVISLSSGFGSHCALTSAGAVKCWGMNLNGQVGDGTKVDKLIPVNVIGLTANIQAISSGYNHTCALTTSGTVKCWGLGTDGQLGDGTFVSKTTPVDVVGLAGVISLSAGYNHTCALISNGQVVCWGNNQYFQIGDGSQVARNIPTTVVGLSGVAKLSSGVFHNCVVTNISTVKCWDQNATGQLGDGTTQSGSGIITATGISDAVDISSGNGYTCARTTSAAVKCWGWDIYGQLGNGVINNNVPYLPTQINGIPSIASISIPSANGGDVLAITTSGVAMGWGLNGSRQLSTGDQVNKSIPTNVMNLTAGNGIATLVSAGTNSSCAILQFGVQCWGSNIYGQLGNNSTANPIVPVDVIGLSGGPPQGAPKTISPVTSNTPIYTWKPAPGSTSYRLKVNGVITVYTAAAAGCESGVGLCTITSTPLPSGSYIWSVQGYNVYGDSSWSSDTYFAI
ncbi:RCC1 domain-containing protein [Undibacterium sp. TJN19]|uniref:RCC1 domain-containing protein n=1 Tax=Undibacterium sp. TJN19 TaxID=3413055 RepID=UPI003BF1E60C